MNKLLLYSLFLFFLGQATEITKKEGIFVSHVSDLAHSKNNELFQDHSKVHDYDLNKVLHMLDHNPFKNFENYDGTTVFQQVNAENKASVNKDFLKSTAARFWLTKFAVHATAQTAYALIAGATSLVYPPAAPVVYCSLQLTFAAFIEIASTIVASETTKVSEEVKDLI